VLFGISHIIQLTPLKLSAEPRNSARAEFVVPDRELPFAHHGPHAGGTVPAEEQAPNREDS